MSSQIGGRVDISNIAAFYHEKVPMFTLSQLTTGYCNQHTPQYKLHACWHIVHACWHRLFYRHVRILCMLNLTQITRVIIHLSLERIILLCFHACRKTKMRYLHYVSRH